MVAENTEVTETTEVTTAEEVNTDVKTLFGMSNKTYDVLKWIAQIAIPVVVTFYSAVAAIWHLPFTVEIVGTASAVDALLGGLLHLSTQQYNKAQA